MCRRRPTIKTLQHTAVRALVIEVPDIVIQARANARYAAPYALRAAGDDNAAYYWRSKHASLQSVDRRRRKAAGETHLRPSVPQALLTALDALQLAGDRVASNGEIL
jgi:hypothetical protein